VAEALSALGISTSKQVMLTRASRVRSLAAAMIVQSEME